MTQRLHSRGKGRSLPAGYQFGDARPDLRSGYGPCSFYRPQNSARFLVDGFPVCESCNHMRHVHARGDFNLPAAPAWRPMHLNAAERLERRRELCRCGRAAHLSRGGMWHCDTCGIGWLPAETGVGPGDIRAAGAGQTGETLTTNGWTADSDPGEER